MVFCFVLCCLCCIRGYLHGIVQVYVSQAFVCLSEHLHQLGHSLVHEHGARASQTHQGIDQRRGMEVDSGKVLLVLCAVLIRYDAIRYDMMLFYIIFAL